MQPGKALVRERETGVVVMHRRVQQNLRVRLELGKGGIMVELVVEHLHHDVRPGKIRKPIAENVLRKKPPPNPTALKVISQRLAERRLRELSRFVAQAV